MMTFTFIVCSILILATIVVSLIRIFRGPTILDRMLAYDLITVSAVAIAVLAGIRWQTAVYLDWVLIISLLGFLSTVALTLYLVRASDRTIDAPNTSEEPDSGEEDEP